MWKCQHIVSCSIALCVMCVTLSSQTESWVRTIDLAKKAVVKITVRQADGRIGTGTGFVCNKSGQVITNHHVVSGATASSISVSDQNGTLYRCNSITLLSGRRSDIDIAILNTTIKAIEPLCLMQSPVPDGTSICAIGHPRDQDYSVTNGLISRSVGDHYQTNALLNPGNSGGPVIDVEGRVVGVVEWKYLDADGIAFMLRSNLLTTILDEVGVKACVASGGGTTPERDTLSRIASMWPYYNEMMILAANRLGLSAYAGDPLDVRLRRVSDELDKRSKVLAGWQDSITFLQTRANQLRQQAYPEHFTFEVALNPSWSLLRYQSTASDMIGLRGELGLAYIIGGNYWSHPDRIGLMVAMQGWRSIDGSPSPTGYLYDLSTYLEFAERVRVIIGIGNTGRFEIRSHENYLYGSVAYNIVRGSLPLGVRAGISSSNDGKMTIISAGLVGAFRTDFFRW